MGEEMFDFDSSCGIEYVSKNKKINDSMNEVKDIGYSFCKEKGVRQHNSDLPIIDKMTTI